MGRQITIEKTDNGGYIIRSYDSGMGKDYIATLNDLDDIAGTIEKIFSIPEVKRKDNSKQPTSTLVQESEGKASLMKKAFAKMGKKKGK